MQPLFRLNPRQQHILWATVQRYVATAEPVGSRVLVQEYNFDVSPATVRNTMGSLEKSGLLYQPHTSAGRVPSDLGYRLYVDQLMQPAATLGEQVESLLGAELGWGSWSFEALLREAAQILSNLSGYLALITVPQTSKALVRHLQLVQVDQGQVVMIVLLDSLITQSVVVKLPPADDDTTISEDTLSSELQILSNFLTEHLRGQSLSEVAAIGWSSLDWEFRQYAEALGQAIDDLARRTAGPTPTQLVVSGLAEVLRQPEFSDAQQIQAIVHLLEEDSPQLWPLFFESPTDVEGQRVRVWIGSENPIEPMQNCALVSSTYGRNSLPLGSVGVLGPTRMVYENAVAIVSAAADHLSEALS
ncbi:heat-inducible transcriptional repressor HrcA [filamentous cyanobacterium CCP5]|nr:heat-inducible transcriptional repressor HrcA [filamentous cyanobacterium CCP5]